jgi:hypothetical protein
MSYYGLMNAVRKLRAWTPEQRLEQSRKLRERKIWAKSTGPTTPAGKAVSSRNARKPDYRRRMRQRLELSQIRQYLRAQRSYIKLINLFIKQQDRLNSEQKMGVVSNLIFLQNELIDLDAKIRRGFTTDCDIIPFPPPDRRQSP